MGSRTLLVAVIAAGLILIAAIGGYFYGIKARVEGPVAGGAKVTADQGAGPGQMGAQPAIEELQEKLKKNPDDVNAMIDVANALFESKRFLEAAELYKRAVKLRPDDVDIYNEIGLTLHYAGNTSDGLIYVDQGIAKNPYHKRIWLTKGFLLAYGMGNIKAAREAWEKAKALDPDGQIGKAAAGFLAQTGNYLDKPAKGAKKDK